METFQKLPVLVDCTPRQGTVTRWIAFSLYNSISENEFRAVPQESLTMRFSLCYSGTFYNERQ